MVEIRRLLEFRMPGTGELLSFKNKQYYVTSSGQVWDDARKRFVKLNEAKEYKHACLCDDEGKWHTTIGVHCLVASVFLRLLEKGEVVHHVNHVKTDNRIGNIVILSASEHSRQHGFENWESGRMEGVAAQASERVKKAWRDGKYFGNGEKMRKAWKDGTYDGVAAKASDRAKKAWSNGTYDYQKKSVAQLSLDGQLIKVWPSSAECGRNCFDKSTVSHCCNGTHKCKTHKGFKWMWYEDYQRAQHENATIESQPLQLEFNFQ